MSFVNIEHFITKEDFQALIPKEENIEGDEIEDILRFISKFKVKMRKNIEEIKTLEKELDNINQEIKQIENENENLKEIQKACLEEYENLPMTFECERIRQFKSIEANCEEITSMVLLSNGSLAISSKYGAIFTISTKDLTSQPSKNNIENLIDTWINPSGPEVITMKEISPELLVSGLANGSIEIFNLKSREGANKKEIFSHRARIITIFCLRNGHLISSSIDGMTNFLECKTFNLKKKMSNFITTAVLETSDKKLIVMAGCHGENRRSVRFYKYENFQYYNSICIEESTYINSMIEVNPSKILVDIGNGICSINPKSFSKEIVFKEPLGNISSFFNLDDRTVFFGTIGANQEMFCSFDPFENKIISKKIIESSLSLLTKVNNFFFISVKSQDIIVIWQM